jgi:PKD repeat protein
MRDREIRPDDRGWRPGRIFYFDPLLLVFLVVGWLLIFASASLALQRSPEQWLPVEFVPEVSADYSVDAAGVSRLAPVRPQIVEAVKQDALVAKPSAPPDVAVEATPEKLPLLVFRPTQTPTAVLTGTITPTSTLGFADLIVSAGGPYTGDEGSPVPLVARGASLSPGTIRYRWDLDEDGLYDDAQGAWATAVFYDEGEYMVGVEATDVEGRVAFTSTTVSVANVAPAIYGIRDIDADEGEEVDFSATVFDPGHDVLLYTWDFGDGAGETGELDVEHTYVDNGEYVVRFRAEDNDGGVTEAVFFARVGNLAPRVDAGLDQEVEEGDWVTLSGSAADAGVLDELNYAWDLEYDGVSFTPDMYGASVSRVYRDGPAEVMAALRVQDNDGGEGLDTVVVTVNNVAPRILSVVNDGPVGEGSQLTLTVDATDVGSDTLSYAFDWENDGEYAEVGQAASASHIWYNQGEYTVGIRAEDGDGGQVYSTTMVSVYNVAPVAVAGLPMAQREGTAVTFDGSGSSDPGIDDVLSYEWGFGDGSAVGSGEVVAHAYGDNGVYSATLTVRDDSGAESTDVVAVSIMNANPVAEVGADREVDEGDSLSFSGTASDPGWGDVLSLAWDLDYDGSHFDEDVVGTNVVDRSYADGPARYVVAFRVRDDDYPYPPDGGGEVGETIDTLEVTVQNVPPRADAGETYEGEEGQWIRLRGIGIDVPSDALVYEWDVDGDGRYDLSGPSVDVVWMEAGEYLVRLRVTDDDGDFGLDTAQVSIGNAPPTAEAGGPYTGDEGSPIELRGSGTDPADDPLTYAWDLGQDGIFETPGQVVTNTWPDNGSYTVSLRVDDGRGGVDIDDAIVIVENVPPTPEAGPDRVVVAGESVTFNGTATDPGADTFTFEWDFDYDGLVFDVDDTGQSVTTSYATGPATYVVALRVTDDDGDFGLDTAQVSIDNAPPTAEAGGPYTGDEGSPIELRGSGTDPDGDPLTYAWDLDQDGIFETPGQVVTYIWPDDGVYNVTLQVGDGQGGVATDDATVTVNNVSPIADAGPDRTVDEGEIVTFTGAATDPGADTFIFEWDFDYDGVVFNVEATGQTVTTIFSGAPPDYVVALRVTDDDNGVGLDTAQVTVGNSPPTADAGGPYTGGEGNLIALTGSGTDPNDDPLTYDWDLDHDGDFETPGQVVTYSWPDDGDYTVTLRVDDGRGGVATDDATVTVNNVPPNADTGGPYTTTVDITLTLVATATDVPADPLTYTWDLDDDGFFDDGAGRTVTYTWAVTGIYTVTLRVADDDGGVTTDVTTVNVNSLYPFAWLAVPYLLVLSRKGMVSRRRTHRDIDPSRHR